MSVDKERAVLDVLLAEYSAIRSAADRKATAEHTLIALNVTGIGAVAGLVLSNHVDQRLLLVLPVLSSSLGLLIFWQDRTLQGTHTYVMETLRPLIVQYTGDDRIFRWQEYDTSVKRRMYIAAAQAIPMGVLFPGASLVALIVVIPRLDSFGYWVAWALGLLAFATLVSCWAVKLRRPTHEHVERLEGHPTGGAPQVATGP